MAYNGSIRSSRWPLIIGAVLCLVVLPAACIYDNQRRNEILAERSRTVSRQLLAKAKVTPINPDGRIELKGHVQLYGFWSKGHQIKRSSETSEDPGRDAQICDAYCSTILRLPGVKSVTIKWANGTFTRFSLRGKGKCTAPSEELAEPDSLADFDSRNWLLAGKETVDIGELGRLVSENGSALVIAWKARLAKDLCVQADFVEQKPDIILDNISLRIDPMRLSREQLKDSFVAEPVRREGLMIYDADRVIVFRRAFAMTTILAEPFSKSLYISSDFRDIGMMNVRDVLTDFPAQEGAALSRVMSEHTNILEGLDWRGPIDDLASDLRKALANPARTRNDPAINFAPIWIESLATRQPDAEEWALLGALIADLRIKDLSGVSEVIRRNQENAVVLASYMKKRMAAEPRESEAARLLSTWLCELTNECPDIDAP